MKNKESIEHILAALDKEFPEAILALKFSNPYECLVATILSAQCTDERVNQVTPALFKKYPDARTMAKADLSELETDIKSTGFFRNKAKNLMACAQALVERHDGKIPPSLDDMVKLPGVGRKTANMVLGASYGIPGIIVDTHVTRVSQRLGLTKNKDAVKIEFDLNELIPRDRWTRFSNQLIWHGRTVCVARKPKCDQCPLSTWCDYYKETVAS